MERAKKTIVVSAVNIRKGGTLTILRGCLEYLSSLPCEEYRVVALVHKRSLADYRNIEYIEIPTTVKSWFRRLWCEYVTMYGISKKLQPVDLWLSLHDTTPRVVAKRQAVYCQTSFPFLKVKIEDLRFDPKIVLFSLFTRFAYQINVHRSKYLIVQAEWLRKGFSEMFRIPEKLFVVCPPEKKTTAFNNLNIDREVFTFLFVSTPDCHKNFETLCEAAKRLEKRLGNGTFRVVLTIKGDENKYSRNLFLKYGQVPSIGFEGFMSKDRLYSFYDRADCLVFPSRVETWGLPITEFAATGKPMLLSDLPFAHETSAGCGKVAFFNPEDPADLMEKMARIAGGDGKTSSQITVKLAKDEEGGIPVGRKAVVYAAIAPGIKKGDKIEIQLLTDSHKVSFEVNALVDFQAGACYDIPLNLDDLKPENNCTVENISTTPLEFKSFGFEIAKNESSLLKKTAVLNTSTSKTEVKAAEDFSCAIDKNAGTVSCCIPYLYNFTLVPTFTVPEGVKVLCNDEVQESGVSSQDFRTPVEYTLVSGTQRKVFTVTVTNTGLPVMVINVNTPGTVSFLDFSIPAKSADWSEADDIAVYKNGVADLNKAGCSIRLRGNTSSNYDKRPMAIKLNKKAGILGMKEHKRWILLSPWTDMSLIRNYLAFNIAQTIQNHFINGPTDGSTLGKGLVWNPSGQNVELVINGIHAGNYLFCEQIKINKNRLKMTNPIFEDVVEKNTSPTVKDCSYLIEFDNNYDETWKFKTTMRELPCLFKDDFKVTATNGTTYDGSAIFESLKTYINTIESNLTNGYYTEAYKSLDINSVIDYWFVYEIAMNDEIQHPKSVYMYKDGDGKLCAGPVWDFDSQNFTNVDTEKNAYYYHTWSSLLIERAIKYNETPRRYYMWWPLLMKDQNYIYRVKARWADVYPDLIDVANRVVEERRAANRLSDEYNRKIWKVGNYLDEHWQCGDENMEFDDVMDNLKYCYNKRLENLNNTITNLRKW